MLPKNRKDFVSGLLCLGAGTSFSWAALRYPVGTAASMGAGFFPLLLGVALALLGMLLVFKAQVFETEDGGRLHGWGWPALLRGLLALALFGLLLGGMPVPWGLPPMGLLTATAALVLVAGWAMPGQGLRALLLQLALLVALAYPVCVVLLGLPLAAGPTGWGP